MKKSFLVVGLGYGDEGKGSTVDFLCREYNAELVVRYNGGAQAAHNVVTHHGKHHTFSQFGSGTFAGARTLLSKWMLINPFTLISEANHLESQGVRHPQYGLIAEHDALITTPFHVATNRLRELARTKRHGSCGMGIGETMADSLIRGSEVLRVKDLLCTQTMTRKLKELRDRLLDETLLIRSTQHEISEREVRVLEDPDMINRCLDCYAHFARNTRLVDEEERTKLINNTTRPIVFEGAQGVLLDQDYGFQPYTTWTNTKLTNAYEMLSDYDGSIQSLGVIRAYSTRHGAGPFVAEDKAFDVCSEHDHNKHGEWQQGFRSGYFDMVTTEYALEVLGEVDGGVDGLVITNVDRLAKLNLSHIPVCTSYDSTHRSDCCFNGDSCIFSINVRDPVDEIHQAELAERLFHCTPNHPLHIDYKPGAAGAIEYSRMIASYLETPLSIVSLGPTADDKVSLMKIPK